MTRREASGSRSPSKPNKTHNNLRQPRSRKLVKPTDTTFAVDHVARTDTGEFTNGVYSPSNGVGPVVTADRGPRPSKEEIEWLQGGKLPTNNTRNTSQPQSPSQSQSQPQQQQKQQKQHVQNQAQQNRAQSQLQSQTQPLIQQNTKNNQAQPQPQPQSQLHRQSQPQPSTINAHQPVPVASTYSVPVVNTQGHANSCNSFSGLLGPDFFKGSSTPVKQNNVNIVLEKNGRNDTYWACGGYANSPHPSALPLPNFEKTGIYLSDIELF